jgi:hypothetical protein
MNETNNENLDATEDCGTRSTEETPRPSEVPTTYIWKGETWPMGNCRGPEQCNFMTKQPGYKEWYGADAEKMWSQLALGINKELARETTAE